MKNVSLIFPRKVTEAKIRKIERLYHATHAFRTLERLMEISDRPLPKELLDEMEYLEFIINYPV